MENQPSDDQPRRHALLAPNPTARSANACVVEKSEHCLPVLPAKSAYQRQEYQRDEQRDKYWGHISGALTSSSSGAKSKVVFF